MKIVPRENYAELKNDLLNLRSELNMQSAVSMRNASLIGQSLDRFARVMNNSSYLLTDDFNSFYTDFLPKDLEIRLAFNSLLAKCTEFTGQVKDLTK